MTHADGGFIESDRRRAVMERLSHAADRTSELARRYLAVRRQSERTIAEKRELILAAHAELDRLHAALDKYVSILRDEGTPRELAVWLVRDAVQPIDPTPGAADSSLLEELERWVVEAYRAA